MSEGYGEHCERLAGYGVGSGELRNYEPFSLENAETVEGNTREEQTKLCKNCGMNVWKTRWEHHITWCNKENRRIAVNVAPSSAIQEDAEETNLSGIGTDRRRNNADPISKGACETAQNIPQDAEAELSTWIDEVERNQLQNERDQEEIAWHEQELLQEETDNT